MSQLEKLFKDSLQNEQAPFDPKAWSSMESKLNQSMPIQATNAWKWVAAAVGTAAVATVAIYSTTNTEENTQRPIAETNIPVTGTKTNTEQTNATIDQNELADENQSTPTEDATNNEASSLNPTAHNDVAEQNDAQSPASIKPDDKRPSNIEEQQMVVEEQAVLTDKNFPEPLEELILPKLKQVYCQNETFELFNANDATMTLKQPSGSQLNIKKGQSGKIELTEPGKYTVSTNHAADKRTISFEVIQAPTVAFRKSNDFIYKDGIPYLEYETMNFSHELTWKLDGRTIGEGEAIGVTVFKQGNYDLTLEAKDDKGCVSTNTQTIRVDKNYNLIAELALRPKSSDRAVNTFMPEALELRSTGFTMIIMDKGTGGTIFQTSDANQGWNGIDARTGEMVSEGVYLWKVVLNDPLPGEKNVYLGTVNVLL